MGLITSIKVRYNSRKKLSNLNAIPEPHLKEWEVLIPDNSKIVVLFGRGGRELLTMMSDYLTSYSGDAEIVFKSGERPVVTCGYGTCRLFGLNDDYHQEGTVKSAHSTLQVSSVAIHHSRKKYLAVDLERIHLKYPDNKLYRQNFEVAMNLVLSVMGWQSIDFDNNLATTFCATDGKQYTFFGLERWEQQLYLTIVDIISRYVFKSIPCGQVFNELAGVVLIEEVEEHLPTWKQKTLLSELSLAFPNTQFVVTSSSDTILESANGNTAYVIKLE